MNKYLQTALLLLCSIAISGSALAQEKKESLFFIQGSVRNPGVYRLEGQSTVLELIQVAGGLTDPHTATGVIIRQSDSADGRQQKNIIVDINKMNAGVIEEESYLQPGDIVLIPTVPVFLVEGEVNVPGLYAYKDGMTLRRAISVAKGTTFSAFRNRVYIFRKDRATGKQQEIRVDLASVMSGKKEDVPIQPDDIIIVPSSVLRLREHLRFIDTPPLRGLPSPQDGAYQKG